MFVKCGTRDAFDIEAWALDRARHAGLRVPEVVAVGDDYLILRRIAGEELQAPERRPLEGLGEALRLLHENVFERFGWPDIPAFRSEGVLRGEEDTLSDHVCYELNWALEVVRDVLGADATQVLERALERCRPLLDWGPGRLLHGDLQVGHVLATDGAFSALIDWADVQVGDPAWEISVLGSWFPRAVGPVLDGYGSDAAFRQRFDEIFPFYRACRHAWGYRAGVEEGWDEDVRVPVLQRLVEQLR